MPWSVIAPDRHPCDGNGNRKIYDVFVPRGPHGWAKEPGAYHHVFLVRTDHLTRENEKIHIGSVMHDNGSTRLTPNWWAMAYFPDVLDPATLTREEILGTDGAGPIRPESARGFATRTFAIEHMLRRTGWWREDA